MNFNKKLIKLLIVLYIFIIQHQKNKQLFLRKSIIYVLNAFYKINIFIQKKKKVEMKNIIKEYKDNI